MFSRGISSAKKVKVYVATEAPLTFDIALSRPGMDGDVGFLR